MKGTLITTIASATALAFAGCGGDDSSDITAFCDKVDELQSAGSTIQGLSGSDVKGMQDALAEAQQNFKEVADVAPQEIQGDVEKAQAFFDDFVEATADADTPADLAGAAQELQGKAQDFEASSQNLQEYTQKNCGSESASG